PRAMSALTDALVAAFADAVAAVDLAGAVADAVPGGAWPRRARVIAVGKAAPAMLEGALARLGERAAAAMLVVPDGLDVGALADDPRLARGGVWRAPHPLPDAR